MDLLCINAAFQPGQLEFWKKHGVVHPLKDKVYQVREVIRNSTGEDGILLEGLVNPIVPFKHKVLGIQHREPNWAISRFRTLAGEKITAKELQGVEKQGA